MTDALDAELPTEFLVAAVQDEADKLIKSGFLPASFVCLASPRTVREQRLVERLGYLIPVHEAAVPAGALVIVPANEIEKYREPADPKN